MNEKKSLNNIKITEKVIKILKTVIDPELNINIVDLGLIYEVNTLNNEILIKLTFTIPSCPMGRYIIEEIEFKMKSAFSDIKTNISITFDPPWSSEMITDNGKMMLGIK